MALTAAIDVGRDRESCASGDRRHEEQTRPNQADQSTEDACELVHPGVSIAIHVGVR